MIAPFDRYPLPPNCHPERPWWSAKLGTPFQTIIETQAGPDFVTVQLGHWRRTDGVTVETDRGYNVLPSSNDGLARMREIDETNPLPMPALRCGQIWWLEGRNVGVDADVQLGRVDANGVGYGIHSMRIAAFQPAGLANDLLLAGPSAPWAPLNWMRALRGDDDV